MPPCRDVTCRDELCFSTHRSFLLLFLFLSRFVLSSFSYAVRPSQTTDTSGDSLATRIQNLKFRKERDFDFDFDFETVWSDQVLIDRENSKKERKKKRKKENKKVKQLYLARPQTR